MKPACKSTSNSSTYLAYRWFDVNGDGLVDLVVSPTGGNQYNIVQGTTTGAPQEPALLGPLPACPAVSVSDGNGAGAYTMCGGMYPWMVYLNHGPPRPGQSRPIFGKTPQSGTAQIWPDYTLYQPMALESDTGDSSIVSTPIGQTQGTLDLDGDGFLDAASVTAGTHWNVFRNDSQHGLGQCVARSDNTPFPFATPANNQLSNWSYPLPFQPKSTEGMLDLNGDGLPDHWIDASSGDLINYVVNYNDGVGTANLAATSQLTMRPSTDAATRIDAPSNSQNTYAIYEGVRADASRTYDVDLDGRVDLVQSDTQTYPPNVLTYFNQGGGFGVPQGTIGTLAGTTARRRRHGQGLRRLRRHDDQHAVLEVGDPLGHDGSRRRRHSRGHRLHV